MSGNSKCNITMVVTMVKLSHPVMQEGSVSTDGKAAAGVRTIKASEFKARCLQLMDEVAESGQEIIITKHGRPVSRLTPYREKPRTLFGAGRSRMKIVGDIISPIDVKWEAETDPDRVLNP